MNGIICLNKPPGFTSFDVVAKLRGMAKTRRVGHGGTLDPMATGVLPLFFGTATKAIDLLPRQDKRYTAAFRLGISTDTQDITGTLLEQRPVRADTARVKEIAGGFVGKSMQLPPMYSAVQVGGKRLYDLARQGIEVERTPREIEIHSLQILRADEAAGEYVIDVHCRKGAYIRSLCHDIGERLGCGATLTALERTQACGFPLADCLTLPEAQALVDAGELRSALRPVESAFVDLPRLDLTARQARLLQNGVRMSLTEFPATNSGREGALYACYGPGDLFLGIAGPAGEQLRVKRLFVRDQE